MGIAGKGTDRERIDPRAENGQQCGQDSRGHGNRDADHDRDRVAERRHDRDSDQGESDVCGHDGCARDQDGSPGGRRGHGDCLANAGTACEALAMPCDEEERVVDAGAEADHGPDHGTCSGDFDHSFEEVDRGKAGHEAEACRQDREGHAGHGAESDEENDHGCGEADKLAVVALHGRIRGHQIAGERGLDAVWQVPSNGALE